MTLIAAVGVAACADSPSAAPKPALRRVAARVGFQPVFSAAARAASAHLADFGITFDHVRILITRPVNEVVKDTTIAFAPGQPAVTLDFEVIVSSVGESFSVAIDYTNSGGVVFHGEGTVQSHAPEDAAPPQEVAVQYTGPGANVTRIAVSPKQTTVVAPAVTFFTVAAFDASNAPVAQVPISWTVSDPTLATISNTGTFTPTGKRGTVTVTATTPSTATDNATVTVSLPAAGIALVSGGGQSGRVGTPLAQPAVVKVAASDGVGVAGVTVNFAPPTGGKVGSPSTVTDANGNASTSLTLGTVVGPQAFAAAAGGFSVAISATATGGDASGVTVVSGGGQSDTVLHALKLPLVVKVADQFGNALSGVTVNWARTAGGGTLGSATSVSGTDGLTSIGYTLGPTTGTETITASVAGLGAAATFTETALAGPPAAIVIISGDAQSGRILTPLASPFVVRVNDAGGNAVTGAMVTWAATNGTFTAATTTTDTTGNSSNTMTLGSTLGAASATATAGGKSATFTATVQAGIVAKAAFQTGPPASNPAGSPLTPAVQVALQDAAGNPTAAGNSVSIALGANPSGGTLTGTLTRNAVGGVATFDDLKIDKVGVGYTLVASSVGTPDVTSSAFTIVPGSAASLAIVAGEAQTAVVNTPVATAASVRLTDGTGNAIPNAPVTFAPSIGSGTVVPPAPVITDAKGVATVTSWTLGRTSGSQTLVVSVQGGPSVTFHATAQPDVPALLAVATQPSPTAQSGIVFATQPSIQLEDAYGNTSPRAGVTVTAAVATGGGTLSGTLTAISDAQGRATFTNLKLNGLIGQRTLGFTSTGLTPTTSTTITLAAGTAVNLAFTVNPSNTTAAAAITPPVVVNVLDADNNTVTTANTPVTLAITTGTGTQGAVLAGTATVAANGGAATFNNVNITTAGAGYTLTATATGLNAAASTTFTVAPGVPANMVIVAGEGQTALVTTAVAVPPSIRVTDVSANPVPGAAVAFAPANGSGSVVPATAVTTNAQGIATPTAWTLGPVAGAQTLAVSSSGVPTVTFHATAQPGPAAGIVIFMQPSAAAQSGIPFATQPIVQLQDASGNATPQSGVTVTAAVATGAGTLGGTLTTTSDATGRATFTNLRLNGVTGVRSLSFTGTGLAGGTSSTITLSAGTPSKLLYSVNPTNTLIGNPVTPAIAVAIADADNNTVTTANDSVRVAITSGTAPPGALLTGTATQAAVNGVATFPGLSINTPGTGYTLTATSAGLTAAVSGAFNMTPPPPSLITVAPAVVDAVFDSVPTLLTGSGFFGATTVTVTGGGKITPTGMSVQGPTSVFGAFNLTGGLATSTENVTVTTAGGTSNALSFTYYAVGTAPLVLGPPKGGPGGSAYSLDCPAGAVATGLNVRSGNSVDALEVICQTVTGGSRTFGGATGTGFVGGAGGSPSTLQCSANYVLVGLAGNVGTGPTPVNDEIAGVCGPIAGGANVNTARVGTDQGGTTFTATCPTGLVLTGVQGNAGGLLDNTQIKCR